jgi:hypothetical protein
MAIVVFNNVDSILINKVSFKQDSTRRELGKVMPETVSALSGGTPLWTS